jgi:hypothetical protein
MTGRLPDDAAPGRARRFRVAVISALGGLIIRLIGLTWRVKRVGGDAFDEMLRRGSRSSLSSGTGDRTGHLGTGTGNASH